VGSLSPARWSNNCCNAMRRGEQSKVGMDASMYKDGPTPSKLQFVALSVYLSFRHGFDSHRPLNDDSIVLTPLNPLKRPIKQGFLVPRDSVLESPHRRVLSGKSLQECILGQCQRLGNLIAELPRNVLKSAIQRGSVSGEADWGGRNPHSAAQTGQNEPRYHPKGPSATSG
jgi:hypothetical protein